MRFIEEQMYFDPQQARQKHCPCCHRAVYAPSYFCPRCEEADL